MDVFTSYGHILALTRQLLVPTFQTKVHCQHLSNHEREPKFQTWLPSYDEWHKYL